MNESKTKSIVFWAKRDKPLQAPLILNDSIIEDVTVHEHLGLTLSSNLSWRAHILHCKTIQLNILKPLKYNLSRYILEVLFKSLVRSSLEYADVVCDGCSESDSNLLESLQIEGARVVTGAVKGTNMVSLLNKLSWVELSVRRKLYKLTLMYKMVFKLALPYLCDFFPNFVSERSSYCLRSDNNLCLPFVRTERHKKSFLFPSIKEWNSRAYRLLQASLSATIIKSCIFHPAAIYRLVSSVGRAPVY